jgi:hypothetical protein
LCLACIGEQFCDELAGIRLVHRVVRDKRMLKFEIWLSCSNTNTIEKTLNNILQIFNNCKMDVKFQSHASL